MNAIFSAGFSPPRHCAMPSASRDRPHRVVAVAGQDVQVEAEPAQRLHRLGRVGAQLLAMAITADCPPWTK